MRPKDDEKRAAIKQATFDLVAEQGLAGLKMASLAKKANISPSTLYVYFTDKENLIRTLFVEVTASMVTEVVKGFQPERPYKINLREVWEKYLHFRIDNHRAIQFHEQVKVSPYMDEKTSESKMMEMQAGLDIIRLGKAHLLLKNVNEHLLLSVFGGMTDRMSDMFITREMELDEANIEVCFTLMWDSIKA